MYEFLKKIAKMCDSKESWDSIKEELETYGFAVFEDTDYERYHGGEHYTCSFNVEPNIQCICDPSKHHKQRIYIYFTLNYVQQYVRQMWVTEIFSNHISQDSSYLLK
jgi:hypothetical protein